MLYSVATLTLKHSLFLDILTQPLPLGGGVGAKMASLLKGLEGLQQAVGRGMGARANLGFHRWNARMKMNKVSNNPTLMGYDKLGNMYFEDQTESFGEIPCAACALVHGTAWLPCYQPVSPRARGCRGSGPMCGGVCVSRPQPMGGVRRQQPFELL